MWTHAHRVVGVSVHAMTGTAALAAMLSVAGLAGADGVTQFLYGSDQAPSDFAVEALGMPRGSASFLAPAPPVPGPTVAPPSPGGAPALHLAPPRLAPQPPTTPIPDTPEGPRAPPPQDVLRSALAPAGMEPPSGLVPRFVAPLTAGTPACEEVPAAQAAARNVVAAAVGASPAGRHASVWSGGGDPKWCPSGGTETALQTRRGDDWFDPGPGARSADVASGEDSVPEGALGRLFPVAAPAADRLPAPASALGTRSDGAALQAPGIPPWLVLGLALLAPLWMLYRRLAKRRVLENATRRAVLEAVLACPGATTGSVAQLLGLNHRTAEHHLRVLEEFGFLSAKRFGARQRYYRNGGAFTDAEQRAHAALANPNARRVAADVLRRPEASLASRASGMGLPKSTVRWHLGRLRRFGLAADGAGLETDAARAVESVLRARERPAPTAPVETPHRTSRSPAQTRTSPS